MTPWEVKGELVAASELTWPTTPTEVYKGPRKGRRGYPRAAGAYIRRDGYNCLVNTSTTSR